MSGFVFGILVLLVIFSGAKQAKNRRLKVYGIGLVALVLLVNSGCGVNSSEAATVSKISSPKTETATKPTAVKSPAPIAQSKKSTGGKQASAKKSVTTKQVTMKSVSTKSSVTTKGTTDRLIPVVVAKNVDGDTIHVRRANGKEEDVRLLLIDTPEDVSPSKPVEPFGYTAADYAKKVVPVGKHVYIEEGVSGYTRDKYGRLLAYLYITPKDMYNLDVVKKGYARVAYIYPPNTRHLSDLQAAQSYAKAHHEGIWSIENYVTSSGYNLTIACSYAKSHGYNTHGCSTSSSSVTHATQSSGATQGSVTGNHLTVRDGGEASVTVKTKPNASGSIEVDYKSGPSKAKGLGIKKANSQGVITWSWKVGSSTTPGTYNVIIRLGGQTITKHLVVTK
ncbi:MAG TPA: thermonuclease family protein [Candidatus Angelobacter sp.]|nr:thermonuclease family protein [Candidatus Angelobacter sp.]